jgi:hypothetical protein
MLNQVNVGPSSGSRGFQPCSTAIQQHQPRPQQSQRASRSAAWPIHGTSTRL